MAYLDDKARVNGRIVLMTIPAVAFFVLRLMEPADGNGSRDLEQFTTLVRAAVFVSPLFVVIQVFKLWEGTAARSWQNIICTLVTAAAAALIWQTAP